MQNKLTSPLQLESLERREMLSALSLVWHKDSEFFTGAEYAASPSLDSHGQRTGESAMPISEPTEFSLPKIYDLNEFVQRLKDAGATMYGAWWCGHCHQQLALFGEGVADTLYVEVSNQDRTLNAVGQANNIQVTPTWTFADGGRVEGVQSFEQLASLAEVDIPYLPDGVVFTTVANEFLQQFGESGESLTSDYNDDGQIDLRDFNILKSAKPAGWTQGASASSRSAEPVSALVQHLAFAEIAASSDAGDDFGSPDRW